MLEKIIFPRELLEFEVANCARFSTSQLLRKDMLRLERAYNFDYWFFGLKNVAQKIYW